MRPTVKKDLLVVFLMAGITTSGCAVETVVHRLNEREANLIIELLADNQIESSKGTVDTGREVFYTISVPPKSRLPAIRLLNLHELPRRKDKGYNEIFSESGLIPTSAEEKAKELAALEGEIERQLKLIDGVIDAQVQIVVPEQSALTTAEDQITNPTASVTLRYLPSAGGIKPVTEAQVQTLIAAGVEKLTPDQVFPLMTPVRKASELTTPSAPVAAGNSWIVKLPAKTVNIITVGVLGLILSLSLMLLFGQLRLRTVRARLGRLQNEIAKARRRNTNEESLPPAAG